MLTRSITIPGTVRRSAHGSRELGMCASSSCVKLVAVPSLCVSTIGDSPLTVTDSWSDATFSENGKSTV
jgi:hypothetical protein